MKNKKKEGKRKPHLNDPIYGTPHRTKLMGQTSIVQWGVPYQSVLRCPTLLRRLNWMHFAIGHNVPLH